MARIYRTLDIMLSDFVLNYKRVLFTINGRIWDLGLFGENEDYIFGLLLG